MDRKAASGRLASIGYVVVPIGLGRRTERLVESWVAFLGGFPRNVPEELIGPPIMHIRHDAKRASVTDRPSYFTNDIFPQHTDLAYSAHPAKYLLLHCICPASQGGQIFVSDCARALALLSPLDHHTLNTLKVSFRAPPNTSCHTLLNIRSARLQVDRKSLDLGRTVC